MFYLILYLLFNALAPIIIHFWGSNLNHDLLILISALTAVIAFHLLNFGKNKATYFQVAKNKEISLGAGKVILTTAIMWAGGFIIPIYYTPFIFVFTYLGWPSLCGALVMATKSTNRTYLAQAILIIIIFGFFYIDMFREYTLLKATLGLITTFITGFSLYWYLRSSKILNSRGMSSKEVLAIRYWLLLLFPLVLVIARHEYIMLDSLVVFKSIFIGLITLVIPLYFGQLCIEEFGSETFSLLMGFTPIITFVLQFMVLKTEFSQVLNALLLALAIGLPFLSSVAIKKVKFMLFNCQ